MSAPARCEIWLAGSQGGTWRAKQRYDQFGSTGVEIGREVCRGIGYVLVLSGKDARGSEHGELC